MNHHSEQVIGNTLCKKLLTENSSIPLQTNKKNKIKLYVIITYRLTPISPHVDRIKMKARFPPH